MKKKNNIANRYIKNSNKSEMNTFQDRLILILKLFGKNSLVMLHVHLNRFWVSSMEGLPQGFG
jgi:hypothetical protein